MGSSIDDSETEFMDTQSSLDGSGSFDNTVPFEDAETQVVCLAGETQVLGFDDETQAMDNLDPAEELCTQLFDDFDTEVVVDTDDEGTKKTEVLSDTEELSGVDSVKNIDSHPVEREDKLHTAMHKHSAGECKDILISEERNTGPVLGGFTSLRVASVRSAGLAARHMAVKRTNSTSCSNLSDNQHEAGHSGISVIGDSYDFDKRHNLEEHDHQMKGSNSKNKCKAGKLAVRKLFDKDKSPEEGLDEHMNKTDKEARVPPACTFENDLAGLSYVDSQEPEEALQTIALDFVDKFLKVNATEFDQDADILKSTGGKSKPLSGAKGTQSLAKRANRIFSASGGIYDWDDNQEDEGGGEFFRKKKETFFDDGCKGRKSFTQPRDSKHLNVKNCLAVKGNTGKVEQQDITNNIPDLVYSDSKLPLQKYKKNDKSTKVTRKSIGKNLIKELDDTRDGMGETGTRTDNLDMLGIGVDTQLAAELDMTDHNSNVADQDAEIHLSSSTKGKRGKKLDKELPQKKASHTLKSGVLTKQLNQTKRSSPRLTKGSSIVSEQHSMKNRKQCNEAEGLNNLHCELIEENLNGTELKNCGINKAERCHGDASTCQKTVKKWFIEEHLSTSSPIACRTRQKTSNQPQRDANTSTDLRERMDSLTDPIASKRKRRRTASTTIAREKSSEFMFVQAANLKKFKANNIEQSDSEISGTNTVQEGKARQKLFEEEISGKSNAKFKISQVKSGIKRITRSSVVCSPPLPSVDGQSGKSLAKDTSVVHNPIDQNGNATSKKNSVFMTPIRCTIPNNEASPICMGDEYHKQSRRKNLLRSPLKKECSRTTADGPESTYTEKHLRKRRDITQIQVLFSQHLDEDIIKQQKKVLARLGASVASSISDATHFVTDTFVRTRNMLEAIANGKPVVTHFWLESCGHASCLIDERNYVLRDAKKEKEIGFSLPVSLARACQDPLLQGCKVFITRNTKPGKHILASLVKAVHGVISPEMVDGHIGDVQTFLYTCLIVFNHAAERLNGHIFFEAVDRVGRSALKIERIPGDLIILSCEEDYVDCVPFLEKGASVYSSELLLNGIVIQKLEYDRYRLFADNVRKTRSTIWLRKDGELIPVAKCK